MGNVVFRNVYLEVSPMNLKNEGKKAQKKWLACTLLSLSLPTFVCPAFADDPVFGGQSWSIVPSGDSSSSSAHSQSASPKASPVETGAVVENERRSPAEEGQAGKMKENVSINPGGLKPMPLPGLAPSPVAAQGIKLYGRIEELASGAGAKIPLKLVAMKPIRDASLDEKLQAKVEKDVPKDPKLVATIAASARREVSFPFDYRGTWSGVLTVTDVKFDPRFYEIDREEAEKQAHMIVRGLNGNCAVTFYQGPNNKIAVKPTQVYFKVQDTVGEQMKMMQGSPLGAMLGAFGGDNSAMMQNIQNMPISVPIAMPLGATGSEMMSNTGITGGTIDNSLMRNNLKELAKGVMENDIVTRDKETGRDGKVKTGYTESVLRFTKQSPTRLFMQAAAVSYDDDGNFLNKVLLSGSIEKGAPVVIPSAEVAGMTIPAGAGGAGDGGMGAIQQMLGGGGGGAGGLGALQQMLGGQGGSAGGAGGLGALQQMLGGQGGGGGASGLGALQQMMGGQGGNAGSGGGLGGLQNLFGGQGGGGSLGNQLQQQGMQEQDAIKQLLQE